MRINHLDLIGDELFRFVSENPTSHANGNATGYPETHVSHRDT